MFEVNAVFIAIGTIVWQVSVLDPITLDFEALAQAYLISASLGQNVLNFNHIVLIDLEFNPAKRYCSQRIDRN